MTTLAGLAGVSGSVDGAGSAAKFNFPQRIATDQAGNIFVADTNSSSIRMINPSGVVTTLAGMAGVSGHSNGTGAAARFNFPQGVAADYFENIYVADTANSIIRKITPQGVVTTLAGKAGVQGSVDGLDSEASFGLPRTIAIDPAGNVYVTDASKPTIRKISKRLGHDNYWGLCFDWTFRWLVGRSSA